MDVAALVRFLIERFDEIERRADTDDDSYWRPIVMADIAVKRRIVNQMTMFCEPPRRGESRAAITVLWEMATAYDDHPDYRGPNWPFTGPEAEAAERYNREARAKAERLRQADQWPDGNDRPE